MKQNQKKRFNNGRFNNRNARQMITRNTVLESSGPCGKLRGTALQLFEKYQIAAKDAMMQSDIVLAQTCMQYADHYIRLQNQAIQNEQQMRGNNNQQQNIQNVMTKEDAVEEVKDEVPLVEVPQSEDICLPESSIDIVEEKPVEEQKPEKEKAKRKPRAKKAEKVADEKAE
ncbi:MAG: DUF4167 domain-containing protein [Alphaproteobacteria bacterium]|nr:DUF4167 domain-containing protein [Alphaproteobacteria bacterium]